MWVILDLIVRAYLIGMVVLCYFVIKAEKEEIEEFIKEKEEQECHWR